MFHQRIFLFFGLLLFWCTANCQSWCGSDFTTSQDKMNYIGLLSKSKPLTKARKGSNYEINIKPKVIHSQQKTAGISNAQIFELIDKLNLVFAEINVHFIVDNNNIEHIYDDNFYDLKTENDGNLKLKYDNKDAINLYFTHSIIRPDLSQLNGYTNLPNLSTGSNSIILSYLENTTSEFSLLKEKIICHEFGHYFGLLHTFQDSNNEDLTKREMVTRGIGANCSTTGDFLCDTPADPYERAQFIFSLDCNDKLPVDLIDFNGDFYRPPTDNYMSYQEKCGFRFTPMQYQTMESGLNIRLSPLAEYSLSKNISNFLSITKLDKNIYCKGESIIANFQVTGNFDPKNQFKVEISNNNSQNFKEVVSYEVINNSQIKIKTDQSWENGSNYRLIIRSTFPYSESPLSQNFEIKSLPSVEITNSQNIVNSGDPVQLKITFGGSGPWQFKDWDGYSYTGITSNTINFNVPVLESRVFGISEIGNSCGILNQKPSVYIEALKPTISIDSQGVFCKETLIKLPISGLKNIENSNYYQVQMTNNQQTSNILPIITPNFIQFYLPQEFQKDKTYSLKVLGKKLGEFSNTMSFLVKTPPEQPSVVTPLNVCFGSENYFLKANGENLKWYNAENTNDYVLSVLLNTMQSSKKVYYVSQSDTNRCESLKSKIEVTIEDPVSGEISGNSILMLGETGYIHLSLRGSSPWSINIDEIGNFIINNPETNIAVNPIRTTQYELINISNNCGIGTTSGIANVLVTNILGNYLNQEETVKVFPNPIIGKSLKYEVVGDKISEIIVITEDGKIVLNMLLDDKSKGEIDLQTLSSGKYLLKFRGGRRNYYRKIVK